MTIKTSVSDKELSAAVAEHVAGWTRHKSESKECYDQDGNHTYWSNVPPFATSANDVLPLLENREWNCWTQGNPKLIYFGLYPHKGESGYIPSFSPTFARAACFCLLRAHGCDVLE